jgi:hypothetical protein
MHAMIIGASGMLGQKLAGALVSASQPLPSPLTELTLVDVAKPSRLVADLPQTLVTADLSLPGQAASLAAARPDLIFHLAAIVSGEAEADFDKGYRVNLDGTRMLFDAIREEGRRAHYCPRLVFASSIAVFGAPFPDMIGDEFLTAPLTSYGYANFCWQTIPAAGFSTASACACQPSACVRACRTGPRLDSSPTSSANRFKAKKLFCQSILPSVTGLPAHAQPLASSCARHHWIWNRLASAAI